MTKLANGQSLTDFFLFSHHILEIRSWYAFQFSKHSESRAIFVMLIKKGHLTLNVLEHDQASNPYLRHFIPTDSHPYIYISSVFSFRVPELYSRDLAVKTKLSIKLCSSCQDLSVLLLSMIVANSSPLPNIDHIMCLMRGWGVIMVSPWRSPKRVAMIFFSNAPPKCGDEWMYIAGMFSRMLSV